MSNGLRRTTTCAKAGDDAREPRFIRTEVGVGYRWVCLPTPGSAGVVDTHELREQALRLRDVAEVWAPAEGSAGDDVLALLDRVIGVLEPGLPDEQSPDASR